MRLSVHLYLMPVLLLHTSTCFALPESTGRAQVASAIAPAPTILNGPLMPLRRNYGLFDRPAPPPVHDGGWPKAPQ
ncbi:hypothetical protein EDD37DRAFT_615393 [Exophiala viscosa]|uniref:Secreted protein n=1 Tax=Exophiala viscosa TaxID=2486360 RepID=A0AAN6DQF8_9EURO|nr:hypothetical protein EDD36DRAFT_443926 [Exophiala viscosa]KAI1628864.1 hypothetical protein EDD37DRAFT_615393 [Exophiala viscosa]